MTAKMTVYLGRDMNARREDFATLLMHSPAHLPVGAITHSLMILVLQKIRSEGCREINAKAINLLVINNLCFN